MWAIPVGQAVTATIFMRSSLPGAGRRAPSQRLDEQGHGQGPGDDGHDVGEPVVDHRQDDRPAVRRVVADPAQHGDRPRRRRADHDRRDHPQRVGGGERDRAFGDADHAHGQRGQPASRSSSRPQAAAEQGRQPEPERRDADRRGAGAHDGEVALLDHRRPEEERDLVDRPAHVEGDHRAEDDGQHDLGCRCSSPAASAEMEAMRSRIGAPTILNITKPTTSEDRTGMTRIGMIGRR